MNTHAISETQQGTLDKRLLRAAIGIGAFAAVLTGYATGPWGIFLLSSASLYFMTTAIVGEGLLDVVVRWTGARAAKATSSHAFNLGSAQRVARGLTAGAALGTVMSGALMMDAVNIFVASIAGFFLATTATIAWCPVVGLLQYLSRRRPDTAFPQESPTVPAVSPLPGRMGEVASGPAADAQEEAA